MLGGLWDIAYTQKSWKEELVNILSRNTLEDRAVKKAVLHTAKVFKNYDYSQKLKFAGQVLKYLTFNFDEDLTFQVVKPSDRQVKLLDFTYELFSCSPYKRRLTKRAYVVAISKGKVAGWLLLSPSPGVLGVRTSLLPSLAGGGRRCDGLEERRGKVLNRIAWCSQARALGDFRKARGVKALYLSTFTEGVYHQLATYWKGLIALETLSLYGVRSQVFRNLRELFVYHKITEGFTDLIFPQVFRENFRDCYKKQGDLMRVIKTKMRKGYYLLSTLPVEELNRRINKAILTGEGDFFIPTLPDYLPYEKLDNTAGGGVDKEFWLSLWELERETIKETRFYKVFESFLRFYEGWEGQL